MIYTKFGFSDPSLYKPLGRTAVSGSSLVLPWSYSGFAFSFNGNGFIILFDGFSDEQPAYLRVTVDGVSSRFGISDGKEAVIIEGLSDGTAHTVSVLRVTEGMCPLTVTEISLVGTAPVLCEKPADKSLKLMFIGDSITCGYGVLAPSDVAGFNTYEEDCTYSYAYLTAHALDADVSFAGASGKGIVANCMGNREDMTIRQAFEWETRQGGCWEHSRFIPDAVIINVGTNDAWGGVSDEEFTAAAISLIKEIRARYPRTPVLWAYGIMDISKTEAIKAAVGTACSELGDVHFLPLDCMNMFDNEVGGGGHPNTNTGKRVAPLLAAEINRILKLKI